MADYFTSWNTTQQSIADTDLGSGSPLLLPDQVDSQRHHPSPDGWPQARTANLYLLDRDNMGKYNGNVNSTDAIYQGLPATLPGQMRSAPVYFNGSIYLADSGGTLKQFTLTAAKLGATPATAFLRELWLSGQHRLQYPPTAALMVSSGRCRAPPASLVSCTPTIRPISRSEYYNSTQAAGNRDAFGNGNKFITPVIANGKVFVGTPSGVAVFGLL